MSTGQLFLLGHTDLQATSNGEPLGKNVSVLPQADLGQQGNLSNQIIGKESTNTLITSCSMLSSFQSTPERRDIPLKVQRSNDEKLTIGVKGVVKLCTDRYVLLSHSRVGIMDGSILRDIVPLSFKKGDPEQKTATRSIDPYEASFLNLTKTMWESNSIDATNTSSDNKPHIVDLAFGSNHWVALSSDGRIFTYGSNEFGQLGLGHTRNLAETAYSEIQEVTSTWKLAKGEIPIQIAVGALHTLVLTSQGLVYGWGNNKYAQLTWNDSTTLQSGDYSSYAIPKPKLICSLTKVLTEHNRKSAKGSSGKGPTSIDLTITKVYARGYASLVLTRQGDVFVWGCGVASNTLASPKCISLCTNSSFSNTPGFVKSVDVGNQHVIAVVERECGSDTGKQNSRQIVVFGLNTKGQLGIEEHYSSHYLSSLHLEFDEVSLEHFQTDEDDTPELAFAGPHSSCVVFKSGSTFVFGSNSRNKLGVSSGIDGMSDESEAISRPYCLKHADGEPIRATSVYLGQRHSLVYHQSQLTHCVPAVIDVRGGSKVRLCGLSFPKPSKSEASTVKIRLALLAASGEYTPIVSSSAPVYHLLESEGTLDSATSSIIIDSFPEIPTSLLSPLPSKQGGEQGPSSNASLPNLFISVSFDDLGEFFTEPLSVELYSHPADAYRAEFERPQNQASIVSLCPAIASVYASNADGLSRIQPKENSDHASIELVPESCFFGKSLANTSSANQLSPLTQTVLPSLVPCTGNTRVRIQVMHHEAKYPKVLVRLRNVPSGRLLSEQPIEASYDADGGCFFFTAPEAMHDFDRAAREAAFSRQANQALINLATTLSFVSSEQAGTILRSTHEAGMAPSRLLHALMQIAPRSFANALEAGRAAVCLSLLPKYEFISLCAKAIAKMLFVKGAFLSQTTSLAYDLQRKPSVKASDLTRLDYAIEISLDGGENYSFIPAPQVAVSYNGECVPSTKSYKEGANHADITTSDPQIKMAAAEEPNSTVPDRRTISTRHGRVIAPLLLSYYRILPVRIANPWEPTLVSSSLAQILSDRSSLQQPTHSIKNNQLSNQSMVTGQVALSNPSSIVNAVTSSQSDWRPIPPPHIPLAVSSASSSSESKTVLDLSFSTRTSDELSSSSYQSLRTRLTSLPVSGGPLTIDLIGAHPCFPLNPSGPAIGDLKHSRVFVVFHPRESVTSKASKVTLRTMDYDMVVAANSVRAIREPRPEAEAIKLASELAAKYHSDVPEAVKSYTKRLLSLPEVESVTLPSSPISSYLTPWISAILENDAQCVPKLLTTYKHNSEHPNLALGRMSTPTMTLEMVPGTATKGRIRIEVNVPSLSSISGGHPGAPQRLVDVYVVIVTPQEVANAPVHSKSSLMKAFDAEPGKRVNLPLSTLKNAIPTYLSIYPDCPAFATAEPSSIPLLTSASASASTAFAANYNLTLAGSNLYRGESGKPVVKITHLPLLSLSIPSGKASGLAYVSTLYERIRLPFLQRSSTSNDNLRKKGLAAGGPIKASILLSLFPALSQIPWLSELAKTSKHPKSPNSAPESLALIRRSATKRRSGPISLELDAKVEDLRKGLKQNASDCANVSRELGSAAFLVLKASLETLPSANLDLTTVDLNLEDLTKFATLIQSQESLLVPGGAQQTALALSQSSQKHTISNPLVQGRNEKASSGSTRGTSAAGGTTSRGLTSAGSSRSGTQASHSYGHGVNNHSTSSEASLASMFDGSEREAALLSGVLSHISEESKFETNSICAPVAGFFQVEGSLDPEVSAAASIGSLLTVAPQPTIVSAVPSNIPILGQNTVVLRGKGFIPSAKACVRLRLVEPSSGSDALAELIAAEKEREKEAQKEREKPTKETSRMRRGTAASALNTQGGSGVPSSGSSASTMAEMPQNDSENKFGPGDNAQNEQSTMYIQQALHGAVLAAKASDPVKKVAYSALQQAESQPSVIVPCYWRSILPVTQSHPTALDGNSLWPSVASVATVAASNVLSTAEKHFSGVISQYSMSDNEVFGGSNFSNPAVNVAGRGASASGSATTARVSSGRVSIGPNASNGPNANSSSAASITSSAGQGTSSQGSVATTSQATGSVTALSAVGSAAASLNASICSTAVMSSEVEASIKESNRVAAKYSQDTIDDLFEKTVALFASALGLELNTVLNSFQSVATAAIVKSFAASSQDIQVGGELSSDLNVLSSNNDIPLCMADFMPITSRFSSAALIPDDSRVFTSKSSSSALSPSQSSSIDSGILNETLVQSSGTISRPSTGTANTSSVQKVSSTSTQPASSLSARPSSRQAANQVTSANSTIPSRASSASSTAPSVGTAVVPSSTVSLATQFNQKEIPLHLEPVNEWPSHVNALLRPSHILSSPASSVDGNSGFVIAASPIDGRIPIKDVGKCSKATEGVTSDSVSWGLTPSKALQLIMRLLGHATPGNIPLSLSLNSSTEAILSPNLLLAVSAACSNSRATMPQAPPAANTQASATSTSHVQGSVHTDATPAKTSGNRGHRGSHATASALSAASATAAAAAAAAQNVPQGPLSFLPNLDEAAAMGLSSIIMGNSILPSSNNNSVVDAPSMFTGDGEALESEFDAFAGSYGLDANILTASAETAAMVAVGSCASTAAVVFGSIVRLAEAAVSSSFNVDAADLSTGTALEFCRKGQSSKILVRSLVELSKLPLSPLQHALLTCLFSRLNPSPSTLLSLALPPTPESCRFYMFTMPPLPSFVLPRPDMLYQWSLLTHLSSTEGLGLIRQHAAAAAFTVSDWGLIHPNNKRYPINYEALYTAESEACDTCSRVQEQQQLQKQQQKLQLQQRQLQLQLANQNSSLSVASPSTSSLPSSRGIQSGSDMRGTSASSSRLASGAGFKSDSNALSLQQQQQQLLLQQQQQAQQQAQQQYQNNVLDVCKHLLAPVNLNEMYPSVSAAVSNPSFMLSSSTLSSGSDVDTSSALALAQNVPLYCKAIESGSLKLQADTLVASEDNSVAPMSASSTVSTPPTSILTSSSSSFSASTMTPSNLSQNGEIGSVSWFERIGTYASALSLGPYAAYAGATIEVDFSIDGINFENTGIKLTLDKFERRVPSPQPLPTQSRKHERGSGKSDRTSHTSNESASSSASGPRRLVM